MTDLYAYIDSGALDWLLAIIAIIMALLIAMPTKKGE